MKPSPAAEAFFAKRRSAGRRAAALLTALALAAALLAGCAPAQAALLPAPTLRVPDGPAFSQRSCDAPSAAEYEAVLDAFWAACSVPGRDAKVERLYGEVLDGFDRIASAAYLAQIRYDAAPDAAAAAEQARWNALYNDLGAQATGVLLDAARTPHAAQVHGLLGGADSAWSGETLSDRALALMEQENDLKNQYTLALAGDAAAVVDGETWTDTRLALEGGALDDASWEAVSLALSRSRNAELGPLLLELTDVRRQLAAECGYSGFSDYAFTALYARDYTPDDAVSLDAAVRRDVAPVFRELDDRALAAGAWDALDAVSVLTDAGLLARVEDAVQALDPELGQQFRYLRENGLYLLDGSAVGNYTVPLPLWGDAFVFTSRVGDSTDVSSLVHEFGHFCSFCQRSGPELLAASFLDVDEIHSQGLELLTLSQAELLYPGAAESALRQKLSDILFAAVSACLVNSFETALYAQEGLTLDGLNRLWAGLQQDYDTLFFDEVDGVCYDWVTLTHLFTEPLYYFSYGTAALSALDLWSQAQADPGAALATYKTLLGSAQPYRAAIAACGLRDVFDPRQLRALMDDVSRLAPQ